MSEENKLGLQGAFKFALPSGVLLGLAIGFLIREVYSVSMLLAICSGVALAVTHITLLTFGLRNSRLTKRGEQE